MKVLLTAPSMVYWWLEAYREEKIDTKTLKEGSIPSLAIYQLASILRDGGYSVKIEDLQYHQVKFPEMQFSTLERQINDVDVVGISTTSLDWFLAKAMAERIKSVDPDIPIIAGGVHATYADEHILKNSKVDYVVRREGEKTLPELLDAMEKNKNLKDVPGIAYKNNGKVIKNENRPALTINEMEETPFPAFDLMPDNVYGKIGIELSRGCKFSCIFCSIPFKKYWRGLNIETAQKRIVHALNYTKKLYGDKKAIFFIDDTFTADGTRAEQILCYLSELDLGDVNISFEARANDLINSNILKYCTKLPLGTIQVGVESGYDDGLKKIRKGTTTKKVEQCASLVNKYGISEHVYYGFIIGFPYESKDDCMKTAKFGCNLVLKYGGKAYINWLKLLPGSYLWENRKDYGLNEGYELFDNPLWDFEEDLRYKVAYRIKREDTIDLKKYICNYQIISSILNEKSCIYLPMW